MLVVSGYFVLKKKEKKRINREILKKWYFDVFKKKCYFVFIEYICIFYILVGFYDVYKKFILCLIF